jgi:predicted amidophosphoribosyltransferase
VAAPILVPLGVGVLVVGVIAWLLTRGSAERPPTKYCFYCGDPVRSDRKHCSHCGTELDD